MGTHAAAGSVRFVDAPTRLVRIPSGALASRDLGTDRAGVPLVALTHLGANLDSWDSELVDALAAERRVILLGYRGVGGSTETVRDRFEDMADDAVAAIRALGLQRVDLFGLSMGGMVAQAILRSNPELVDRVVLASTGPEGGPGLTRMTGVMIRGIARGIATLTNPTTLLFFTRSPLGRRAAKAYQARMRLRHEDRDAAVTPSVFRAQLRAVSAWGRQQRPGTPFDQQRPVLILHGDSDRMVPMANVDALRVVWPQAQVHVFPDSGHGVVFQNRRSVADLAVRFLHR
jgi:pimeloyl-ACP methyl ester carboxylesterase